jgi:hypothetical protein
MIRGSSSPAGAAPPPEHRAGPPAILPRRRREPGPDDVRIRHLSRDQTRSAGPGPEWTGRWARPPRRPVRRGRPGRDLGASGRAVLQVHGSAMLARSLHEAGLVDEFRILVFPVYVGKGKRLFSEGAAPSGFTHHIHRHRVLRTHTSPLPGRHGTSRRRQRISLNNRPCARYRRRPHALTPCERRPSEHAGV